MSAPILAIDIGTSAVKAARFDVHGEQSGPVVTVRHRTRSAHAGLIDADALVTAVQDALQRIDLAGVSIVTTSTVWHAVVPVDAHGDAVGPAVTWEVVLEAEVGEQVVASLGTSWSHQDSGAYLHSSFPVVTWPWLIEKGAHSAVDLGSWVVGRLAGGRDRWPENIASGSGLWSQRHRSWNLPACQHLKVDPPTTTWEDPLVTSPGATVDLPGAMWLPPVGDGLCHNLGEGAVGERIAITVGTSGSVRAVDRHSSVDGPGHGLWRYRIGDEAVVTGGAVTSAGNALEWISDVFGQSIPWTEVSMESVERMPVADASIFGRRGPDYPWSATGSLTGVSARMTREDVMLAWAIDVWRVFAQHHAALRQVRGHESTVVAAGGLVNSQPDAAQVLADALDTPVSISAEQQPALRGAALRGAVFSAYGDAGLDAVVRAVHGGDFAVPEVVAAHEPRSRVSTALRSRWGDLLAGSR